MVGEKESLEKADALAYGLGHGGLELIFLGLTSLINLYIVLSAVQTQNPQVMQLLSENMLKLSSRYQSGRFICLVLRESWR